MIEKKEFYFVRHGQTDHNISKDKDKGDHLPHIPLNQTGFSQAHAIEPIVAKLPIVTVCASPMIRAQQTKEIITAKIEAPHHAIDHLGECSAVVWQDMRRHGMYGAVPADGVAREFMERVREGLNLALSMPGPVLIVAHGGVHWAACCLMGIDQHEWAIDNCGVVHFKVDSSGKWVAQKL